MAKLAKDVMTKDPKCCTATTPLTDVAWLMVDHDCGQIPVVDDAHRLIGVVTDRDIVCRVVAKGKNPSTMTAGDCMTQPATSVKSDAPLDDILMTMEEKQIRRVPVVDDHGLCCGIISQADVAREADGAEVGEMVREVSRAPVAV